MAGGRTTRAAALRRRAVAAKAGCLRYTAVGGAAVRVTHHAAAANRQRHDEQGRPQAARDMDHGLAPFQSFHDLDLAPGHAKQSPINAT